MPMMIIKRIYMAEYRLTDTDHAKIEAMHD